MRLGRAIMAVLYIAAGASHFIVPAAYERILPPFLPQPFLSHRYAVIAFTGVAEIAGGLGLLWEPTRRAAAICLALLLIAVFPANLWMVQHADRYPNIPVWALWLRLPLQLPLLWWAWQYTKPEATPLRLESPTEPSAA